MKIKPAQKSGGVIVELGPRETQFSPVAETRTTRPLDIFQLKRILVPVDFTQCSDKALLYAVAFARQFQAELALLHVVAIPLAIGFDAGAVPEIEPEEETRQRLDTLRDHYAGDIRCDTIVRHGIPSQEIVDAAKEFGSDLIIVATHARTGLERLVLGSTAEKVVRHARCPVLVVREIEHEFIAHGEDN